MPKWKLIRRQRSCEAVLLKLCTIIRLLNLLFLFGKNISDCFVAYAIVVHLWRGFKINFCFYRWPPLPSMGIQYRYLANTKSSTKFIDMISSTQCLCPHKGEMSGLAQDWDSLLVRFSMTCRILRMPRVAAAKLPAGLNPQRRLWGDDGLKQLLLCGEL